MNAEIIKAINEKNKKHPFRKWWNNYSSSWGGKIRRYLIDEFELEGFTKELGNCDDGWTEIYFTLIENN